MMSKSISSTKALPILGFGIRQISSRRAKLAQFRSVTCQRRGLKVRFCPVDHTDEHLDRLRAINSVTGGSLGTISPPKYKPLSKVEYVDLGGRQFHAVFLRDACTCPHCVDPSTKQKNFQTTHIPENIRAASVEGNAEEGYKVTWENDIPGLPATHTSHYTPRFLLVHSSRYELWGDRMQAAKYVTWNKEKIADNFEFVEYENYMTNNKGLFRALLQLYRFGIVLVRGVPDSEDSVEKIALRIGNLRDTLYGRTWDVKSVPQAKNVAYTAQFLGLHMDLLYMANPPGFQLLHCLRNTCEGGSSLFTDSFYAASRLSEQGLSNLVDTKVPYQYRNAGEHYYFQHPVIELKERPKVRRIQGGRYGRDRLSVANVNYSPPFQANFHYFNEKFKNKAPNTTFPRLLDGLREFATLVEDPNALFEYRLQEGECVIFNNRRILHGRRQFDTSGGERWLKGAYIDSDVLMSRGRVLRETMSNRTLDLSAKGRQYVYPKSDVIGDGLVDVSVDGDQTSDSELVGEEFNE